MTGYSTYFVRITGGGGGGGGVDAGSGSITFNDTSAGAFVIPLTTTVTPAAVSVGSVLIRAADLPFPFSINVGRNVVAFNITAFGAGTISGMITGNTFAPGDSAVMNVMATA